MDRTDEQLQWLENLLAELEQFGHTATEELRATVDKLKKAKKLTQPAQTEPEVPAEPAAETVTELPLDLTDLFADDPIAAVHAESIADGLVMSLCNLGRVDIGYITSITGADMKSVICTLRGAIYQNPETWEGCYYKGWETAEEYLSGNMVRKWKQAKRANEEYPGCFADNLQAIEKVLPGSVATADIYVTLGSPWVPADVIDDFICYILHLHGICYCKTTHDLYTGTWEISNKSTYKNRVACKSTYGTMRLSALHILERTLNMKSVAVTDEVFSLSAKNGKKRVINRPETLAAMEKQQKLVEAFQKWVWKDPRRKERLEQIFENNFSCVRRRCFDGSFLQFPGMDPAVRLYPYQKNAVARILFSPNTLLAHDVGSGKTYIMIAAGMELRRMGLSKKNLYVVPNNLVGQWNAIFRQLYPQAKVLCVEPKSFTPNKRTAVLEQIRDGDYDGIIIAYSCFESVGLSRDYYIRELERTRAELQQLMENKKRVTARLRRKAKEVDKRLFDILTEVIKSQNSVCFDELGITRLFVDEAHNFKNVPMETKTDRVLGISSGGSAKCQDMLDKVRMIQRQNQGGGVVMATGTPITNSITDVFVMQQYLQSGELAMLDLQTFDSWVGMFAERVTEFEVDVDTSSYRLATRFSRFHNLPELTAMLASVADFHRTDVSDGVPEFDGYTDALIGKTPGFADYLEQISERADAVRQGLVERTEDNMLKITTDGRKAALDLRLVDPEASFDYRSKVSRCADNVYELYHKTADRKSTQLVFCDSSTPKPGFNMYDELKFLLVSAGIPEGEIAYIHDATTETKRQKLFSQVREGQVRVLIGSTFKLGLGVNVQDKLIAVHHLDVPWRPADMTQREGRILRQGNENTKVQIYRYITEGSFDAYSWQLLETKQRFIVDLLSGVLSQRAGSDIEDIVLSYAEVKALAVGNPLVRQRVETANELTRLLALQRKAVESHIALEKELMELPGQITWQKEQLRKCREDGAFVLTAVHIQDPEQRRQLRRTIFEAVQDNVLQTSERVLLQYRGFDLVLPANMRKEKPYVWLCRLGKYYVELGEAEVGYLTRLDNVVEGMESHGAKLLANLEEMQQRQQAIRTELRKKSDHTDAIARCKERLEWLDRKLGVEAQ